MKNNMVSKVVVAVLVAATAFSTVGCSVNKSVTKTETHSYTDADGNTTSTTTTTVKDNNGTRTTTETTNTTSADEAVDDFEMVNYSEAAEATVATIAFENETGVDFAELYFASSNDSDWGSDILGDNAPLEDEERITFDSAFRYSNDNVLWDVKAVDSNGDYVTFEMLDMTSAEDPENIHIVFEYNAETEGYTATVF